MTDTSATSTLCLVVCGAGPAQHAGTLVGLAQRRGWEVTVVATPMASSMINLGELARLSGRAVRSDYRPSGGAGPRPGAAQAIVVAPATYNFVNKLAAGINDTYALNVVAEGIGRGTPVSVLPFVNTALAARRPFQHAVASLRAEGVRVIYGPGQWQPHPPGTGDAHLGTYPWHGALDAISRDPAARRLLEQPPPED
ncbi:flavoprotein [Pseudosporangium ferrugineum]|uniref:flavoprotein n=1 Tax=Pseudosporangium ferrugineum TaxID=439699 RepID=UPI000D04DD24|nr:flavoprotein [Pseudosporangium ferrugineum]